MATDSHMKNECSDTYTARKSGLSCAECRRSKLKCDRIFPCQSCVRRGCSGICPDGTLAATKGNKVLMAQAQRLTDQVRSLTSRVRELESALARVSGGKDDALAVERESVLSNGVDVISEAIGSLSLGIDGQARYHGESAGSEYLQDLLPHEETPHYAPRHSLDFPDQEIFVLMDAFPFGFKEPRFDKSIFIPYVPPKARAMELARVYYSSVAWMYDPIPYKDFVECILDPIYGSADYPHQLTVHSHRLAVFFMVLANGNLFYDESHADAAAVAEQYYALARAAFSLDSVLVEVTHATVQALFLVFRFVYNSSQSDKEERWLLTGLTTRIAQTIGLQRDSAAWDLNPEEVQRRRHLFWELFVWESWSSLVHGRPGSLFIQHADCRYPEDLHQVGPVANEGSLGFHAWKFRYSAKCMTMSIEHVFSTRYPTYPALLHIDDVIQNYPIPKHLRWPEEHNGYQWSSDPALALQQYCTLCVRDSNLLYLHRSYFAQAIREAPDDPLKHRYKRSVEATLQVSRRLISVLKSLSSINRLCRTVWFFWSGYFSSCVVLAALVVESPGCSLTEKAIHELTDAVPFFETNSKSCRPPAVWNFLQSLYQRARDSYMAFKSGHRRSGPPLSSSSDEPDELEVVNGRRHSVITTKSNPNSPSQAAASPSTIHQERSSPPVPQNVITNPSVNYYPPMDTSTNMMTKPHHHQPDFPMEHSLHRFEDHPYPSSEKALHDPLSRDSALPRVVPTTSYVTSNHDVGMLGDVHPTHLVAPREAWNYGVSHDSFSQQASQHQTPQYLPYVHSHNAAGSSYSHTSRPFHGQPAQNELWGMLGYGPVM